MPAETSTGCFLDHTVRMRAPLPQPLNKIARFVLISWAACPLLNQNIWLGNKMHCNPINPPLGSNGGVNSTLNLWLLQSERAQNRCWGGKGNVYYTEQIHIRTRFCRWLHLCTDMYILLSPIKKRNRTKRQMFIHFIHLVNTYLLSTCLIPDSILGTPDTTLNDTHRCHIVEEDRQQMNEEAIKMMWSSVCKTPIVEIIRISFCLE